MSLGFAEVAAWGTDRQTKGGNRQEQWGKSKNERDKDDDRPVSILVVSKQPSGRTHAT